MVYISLGGGSVYRAGAFTPHKKKQKKNEVNELDINLGIFISHHLNKYKPSLSIRRIFIECHLHQRVQFL